MHNLIQFTQKNEELLFFVIIIVMITTIISLLKTPKKYEEPRAVNKNISKDTNKDLELKLETKKNRKTKVDLVIDRFIKIYEEHGIQQNQIPNFIDSKFRLELKDFKNNESILQVLDNDLIEWTCKKFGVKREWIDGTSNEIYGRFDYYKQVEAFIDDICELNKDEKEVEIYAFKKGELYRDDENQDVILLIRYPIGKINSKKVYRYIPVRTYWRWGYWRSRYQIKAIFYICSKLGIFINGYDLKERREIADGTIFPEELLNKIPLTYTWYPEDYIDLISQNVQAKEIDETEKVKEYIKKERYIEYLNNTLKMSKKLNELSLDIKHSVKDKEIIEYDVFLSHSSLDKDIFVSEFSEKLSKKGLKVFEDVKVFKVGQSQTDMMNMGILNSRFVVVFLSHNFINSGWSDYEFKSFLNREINEKRVIILPIWHDISVKEVRQYNPYLVDKFALNTQKFSVDEIVEHINQVVLDSMAGD
ncbi:toll/interleukin-1 receptor domain-containing protein [Lysinibacillus capsici]|uniref:toll/interleukin-1 receptor domain-containing protein n=1 Tax=Lysinibacillus capsici TaxID=2115968 RepID=UPI003D000E46